MKGLKNIYLTWEIFQLVCMDMEVYSGEREKNSGNA